MTEDEAKTKWCCAGLIFEVKTPSALFNGFDISQSNKCIASSCMAWQSTDNEFEPENPGSTNAVPQVGKPAGYCGLAK